MSILATNENPVRATAERWQQIVKRAVRDPFTLCEHLALPQQVAQAAAAAAGDFPLFAPQPYLSRIRPGDANDPLLLQLLPRAEEGRSEPGFVSDPVGDRSAAVGDGLLRKYSGRMLLLATGVCGIHCRYCFRREFPYAAAGTGRQYWQAACTAIEQDRSIDELILSGGDPLMLTDGQLRTLILDLNPIAHLRRLRIHTRMPVVIPQRITAGLLSTLRQARFQLVIVIHANHARELDRHVQWACHQLADVPAMLLNQSVLLRQINDSAATLVQLSRRLLECRVLPYYLHQLDRVRSTGQFEVPLEVGRQLIEQMRAQLPGYAVPRYVQEVAGQDAKQVLA